MFYIIYILSFLTLTSSFLFFFNDTATTEIYTLSLHDALPIWPGRSTPAARRRAGTPAAAAVAAGRAPPGRAGGRPTTGASGLGCPAGHPSPLAPVVEIGRAHV